MKRERDARCAPASERPHAGHFGSVSRRAFRKMRDLSLTRLAPRAARRRFPLTCRRQACSTIVDLSMCVLELIALPGPRLVDATIHMHGLRCLTATLFERRGLGRRSDAPCIALDARAGSSYDQSGPARERQVVPHPVRHHHDAIAETGQVIYLCDAPDEPAQHTAELQPVDLYNCALAPNRRDRTQVAVAKWRERLRLAACDQ